MQLNVYIPRDKEAIIEELDATAKRIGRPKNELVLEAVEAYLVEHRPALDVFRLGEVDMPSRDELYGERWER